MLGTIRTLWVVPRFGARTAELMETPIMLIVIVFSARWIPSTPVGTVEAFQPAGHRLLGIGPYAHRLS